MNFNQIFNNTDPVILYCAMYLHWECVACIYKYFLLLIGEVEYFLLWTFNYLIGKNVIGMLLQNVVYHCRASIS